MTASLTPLDKAFLSRPGTGRITNQDAELIAKLMVERRLTEREACAYLGLKERSWHQWKRRGKNTPKLDATLSRARAAFVASKIASIDEMGQPSAGKKRDWRAHAWLLERADPARFAATQPPQQTTVAVISPQVFTAWLQEADKPQGEILDVQAKAIPERASCGSDTPIYSGVASEAEHNTPQDSQHTENTALATDAN